LLDFWPLGRFQGVEPRKTALRLIAEKIPLLGLSAIFSILYLFIQKEQVNCGEQIPLVWRAINALISYGTYIQQLFFPAQLAPFYPLQPPFSLRDTLLSILLLSTISLGVFVSRKKRPFLVTGWLWYLGMLVPVIGLVQVGIQSHADRYTYLPHLGLLMMLVWLIPTPPPGRRTARIAPAIAAGLLVTTYATAAFLQTRHWKNSRTLWEHALTCTDPNHIALGCLALAKQHQGDLEGALKLLRQSLDLYANDPATHNNIGNILLIQGEAQAALDSFNSALLIEPDAAVSLSNKAKALVELGKSEAALECLEAALRRDPDQPELFDRTGLLLIQLGRTQESIAFFEAAARLRPKWDLPQVHLGGAYILLKRPDLTAEHFRIALELNPNQPAVFNYIGNQLLRQGRHAEAITFYRQALEIQPTLTVARDGLLRAMEKEPPAAQTPHISNSEGAVEAIFIPTP
jgi:tetratricopeptide (TPR) repeat protein